MEYLPRIVEKDIDKWMERKEFIIIKGPRQSGKTTLLKHLAEKYNGVYYTFEEPKILELFEKDAKEFIRISNNRFIFIDEAQYCKNIGKILKYIYDVFSDKVKIVVTGSGSFDIKVLLGSFLVGRCTYFELLPLNFEEFLLWKDKVLYEIFLKYRNALLDFIFKDSSESLEKIESILVKEFQKKLEEFLIYGGYPSIVKESEDKIRILRDLTLTYIERDINFFFDIFQIEKFKKLLIYLSSNISNYLEISNISKELGISFQTIQNYLSILSNTYVIALISPFYKNLASEIRKQRKIFFVDLGLRNFLIDDFRGLEKRNDKGNLYENFVFNEIKNFGKVNYWRTKNRIDIDFVLSFRGEFIPIEVKSKSEISKNLIKFIKVYKPKKAIVFNECELRIEKIGKTKVAIVPLFFV